MNKKVLAVAVAATMAAPVIVQADTDFYGQVTLAYDDNSANNSAGLSSPGSGSRIGVSGSTELDNGLTAIYKGEWKYDAADGGENLGASGNGRTSFVGLRGGFGTIKLGTELTALSNYLGTYADQTNYVGTNGLEYRKDWLVSYTNNFGAVDIQVDLQMRPSSTDNLDGNRIGIGYAISDAIRVSGAFGSDETNDASYSGIGGSYSAGNFVVAGYTATKESSGTETGVLGFRVGASSGDVSGFIANVTQSPDGGTDTSDLFGAVYYSMGGGTSLFMEFSDLESAGTDRTLIGLTKKF